MTRITPNTTACPTADRPIDWRRLLHRKAIWRLVWLLLFVLHLPATVKVYGSATAAGEPTAWSSLILLAVTNIFFVVEICFAWSLRILSDRRCLIAFVLIVALMHAGVLERVMPDAMAEQGVDLVLFVSTAVTIIISELVVESAGRLLAKAEYDARIGRQLAQLRRRYDRSAFAVVRVPRYSPFRSACAHRAPPSH